MNDGEDRAVGSGSSSSKLGGVVLEKELGRWSPIVEAVSLEGARTAEGGIELLTSSRRGLGEVVERSRMEELAGSRGEGG